MKPWLALMSTRASACGEQAPERAVYQESAEPTERADMTDSTTAAERAFVDESTVVGERITSTPHY